GGEEIPNGSAFGIDFMEKARSSSDCVPAILSGLKLLKDPHTIQLNSSRPILGCGKASRAAIRGSESERRRSRPLETGISSRARCDATKLSPNMTRAVSDIPRSEERRVGKECSTSWQE